MSDWIVPQWPAPARVQAYSTTRHGGVSAAPWDSLNLGAHVGDEADRVMHNRQRVVEQLALPAMPQWLEQVHGQTVARLPAAASLPRADAAITRESGVVCAVMTADCLPVLFCSDDGSEFAAAHAGWRGLCHGVLEQTLAQFYCPASEIHAWLGPAIGPQAFEVGPRCAVRSWRRMPLPMRLFARSVRNILPISGCWQPNACRPLACDLSRLTRAVPIRKAPIFSPSDATESPGVWQL
ncbi:hypothetical protein E05_25170 [Plautia stali symbiont]|nr:hypothetical protein E05_25170 [Plautia stali symbiont]